MSSLFRNSPLETVVRPFPTWETDSQGQNLKFPPIARHRGKTLSSTQTSTIVAADCHDPKGPPKTCKNKGVISSANGVS